MYYLGCLDHLLSGRLQGLANVRAQASEPAAGSGGGRGSGGSDGVGSRRWGRGRGRGGALLVGHDDDDAAAVFEAGREAWSEGVISYVCVWVPDRKGIEMKVRKS
jgi:hypothetical protein